MTVSYLQERPNHRQAYPHLKLIKSPEAPTYALGATDLRINLKAVMNHASKGPATSLQVPYLPGLKFCHL